MTSSDRAARKAARAASEARMAESRREAQAALHANRCPQCGQGVHRNLALTGWVKCDGAGADGFRKNGATYCPWQGFTE